VTNQFYTLTPIAALEIIQCLAEGSRTANTLPHIARIAAASLAANEAWLKGESPTGAEVEYAKRIAMSLHDQHYPEFDAWKPLPDLAGILTQIDNMTSGLTRKDG
jgi:hypothetical protein